MNGRSWRLYLLLGALAALPIVVIPDSWWYTAWYDTLGLSAVAAILVGVRRNRPGTRGTWWWLAAGQLLFVLGDLLFDLHERVWHTEAFPSAADGSTWRAMSRWPSGCCCSFAPAPRAGTGPA